MIEIASSMKGLILKVICLTKNSITWLPISIYQNHIKTSNPHMKEQIWKVWWTIHRLLNLTRITLALWNKCQIHFSENQKENIEGRYLAMNIRNMPSKVWREAEIEAHQKECLDIFRRDKKRKVNRQLVK